MRLRMRCFVLFATVVAPAFAQERAPEEKALREMWIEFEEAFNQSDARKVAGLYAPDGDRINAAGDVAHGRAEVEKQYQAFFARRRSDPSTVPFHATVSVRFLRPEVALLDGKWTGMQSGQNVRGHFTVAATKDDGRWYIAAGRDRGLIQP